MGCGWKGEGGEGVGVWEISRYVGNLSTRRLRIQSKLTRLFVSDIDDSKGMVGGGGNGCGGGYVKRDMGWCVGFGLVVG